MLQTTWSAAISPALSSEIVNGVLLKNISLVVGSNQVNHRLGRKLQGWLIVRKRAAGAFYDTQDTNRMADKTLLLVSDSVVNVDLWCF